MPTDKEFAEMAVEAEQEVAELFQEYLKEARGKRRRKPQQPQVADQGQPQLAPPAMPTAPMGDGYAS